MIQFSSIRAMSIRAGDRLPMPLPSGAWDRRQSLRVNSVGQDGGVKVFALEGGKTVRALPMNTVPFLPQ